MGKVHYKFTYNQEIDFPEAIEFDGISANLKNDNKGNYVIEGDVNGPEMDQQKKLPIFVSSSGRTGRTWQLEVSFNGNKIKKFPIEGSIMGNGFFTLNDRFEISP
jgi:hypothetical protein